MAEDWYADVKKYVPNADTNVVAAIVRYCGIALQNRDSSLVSFTDEVEVARVRENYLKKKLGLTDSDASLNQAIAAVGERMKGDRTRNRVTVYYLLAEHFKKLGIFGGDDTVAAAPTPPLAAAAAAATGAAAAGAAIGAGASASGRDAGASAAKSAPAAQAFTDRTAAAAPAASSGLMRWLPWLIGAAVLLALLWFFLGNKKQPSPPPATSEMSAPVDAAVPAPATTAPSAAAPAVESAPAAVAGLPANVYFDVGSFAAGQDGERIIVATAAAITTNGLKVAITGYTDKTGDLAKNQELAKNRAKAVRDRLMAAGVPEANIEMKPPAFVETGAAASGDAEARRVEITRQ